MSSSNAFLLVLGFACATVACSGADDSPRETIPTPDGGVAPDGGGTDAGPVPPPPPLCVGKGRSYLGFAGEKLEEGGLDAVARQDARAGSDRVRVKPYRVTNPTPNFDYTMKVDALLAKDMQRVLGAGVGAVDGTSVLSALGTLPDRWYVEPSAGAVPIYATYVTAFKACTKYVRLAANKRFEQAAATAAAAAQECTTMQTRFWSRVPAQSEIDVCASVAVDASNDVASGTTVENALGRWTAACAAVLSAEGFVTY